MANRPAGLYNTEFESYFRITLYCKFRLLMAKRKTCLIILKTMGFPVGRFAKILSGLATGYKALGKQDLPGAVENKAYYQ